MEKYCINQDYTIKEAIEKIDLGKDRVAIVINNFGKVIGILSQGDIIRALSAGKNLYSQVIGIIQPSFLYLNRKDYKAAYKLFKKKKITLLPIVNEDFKLIDVLTLDDIYDYLEGKRNE